MNKKRFYEANQLVQMEKGDWLSRSPAAGSSQHHSLPANPFDRKEDRAGSQASTMKEELMDTTPKMHPYALSTGEGWTYHHVSIDFTIKAGELGPGRHLAVMECITRRGEEPPDHTHPTEDEIFYVLQGTLTFRCGEETFELDSGGFMFLPRGIQHGYTIRSKGDVRLLVMTTPAQEEAIGGWDGFVADIEAAGELRTTPPRAE